MFRKSGVMVIYLVLLLPTRSSYQPVPPFLFNLSSKRYLQAEPLRVHYNFSKYKVVQKWRDLFGIAPARVYLFSHITVGTRKLINLRFHPYPAPCGKEYFLLHLSSFDRHQSNGSALPTNYPIARASLVFGLSSLFKI